MYIQRIALRSAAVIFVAIFVLISSVLANELDDKLLTAAEKGDLAAVKTLIEKGADVNAANAKNSNAILFASMGKHIDVMKLLLEHGADPDMRGENRNSAWAYAKSRVMLDKNPEPIYSTIVELIESSRMKSLSSFLQLSPPRENIVQEEAADSVNDVSLIVSGMIELLSSPDIIDRENAAYNLKIMGKKAISAVPALMELVIEDEYYVDFKPRLPNGRAERIYHPSLEAALALVSIGGTDTIKPLINMISGYGKRRLYQKTMQAIKNKKETAIEPLLQMLLDGKSNKGAVIEALNEIDQNWGQNEAVKQVILELASDLDTRKRRPAAASLNIIGKANSDIFVEMLKQNNAFLRRVAATALKDSRDKRIILPVLKALEGQDYTTASMMKDTLRKFGAGVYEQLIAARDEWQDDVKTKNTILGILFASAKESRESESPVYLEFLISTLQSADSRVGVDSTNFAKSVINELGLTNNVKIIEPIMDYIRTLKLLDIRNWSRRGYDIIRPTTYALERVSAQAVLPLIGYLDDEHPAVREIAVDSLQKIGDSRAIEPLFFSIKEEDPKIRVKVAFAFINWKRKDPTLLHPLLWLLEKYDNENINSQAATALGSLGDERAISPLIRSLGGTNSALVQNASASLRTLTGKDFGENQSLWQNYMEHESGSKDNKDDAITGITE